MFICPRCSFLKNLRRFTGAGPRFTSPFRPSRSFSSPTWSFATPARQPVKITVVAKGRRWLHANILPAQSEQSPEIHEDDTLTPVSGTEPASNTSSLLHKDVVPICCPGCGAYSQTTDPNEPGYYSRTRKRAKKLWYQAKEALAKELKEETTDPETATENEVAEVEDGEESVQDENKTPPRPSGDVLLLDNPDAATRFVQTTTPPPQICDRCHNLIHHNQGISAPSPTVDSIRAFLEESPHNRNRVYHVVDAADFPMSLVRNIYRALDLQNQRSKNRRAGTYKYKRGKRMTTISFIITRSDLLAATKEQVDTLMQRIRQILVDYMRLHPEDIRLGNVHMISAHRGWWTAKVKEEIREHGGGIWVVGKTNVGKSSFITTCFPKDGKSLERVAELLGRRQNDPSDDSPYLDPDGLLPPLPREELYPTLPIVSSLPGTTVSPIRIPFGRGRGEMIDLPGLDRGTLQDLIKDEHKADMIMTKRVNPDQLSIRPGQSLLLGGGLIRITPLSTTNDDTETTDYVVLAACFIPLETHVTRTDKAIEIQTGEREYNTGGGNRGTTIAKPSVLTPETIRSAGIFELTTDVTLHHLPSLVKKRLDDHGIKPGPLPYQVLSTDILIEGCGWIELTAQIRSRTASSTVRPPQVEIFTPLGQHVASRPPLETWNFIREKRAAEKRQKSRTGGSHRPTRQNISHKKRTLHGRKGA